MFEIAGGILLAIFIVVVGVSVLLWLFQHPDSVIGATMAVALLVIILKTTGCAA